MLDRLRKLNQNIDFYSVLDDDFDKFGRVIKNIDSDEIIKVAEKQDLNIEGSCYVASEPLFEQLNIAKIIKNEVFGEMPTQVGYCYGHNNFLNATEWHTSSELNIAITDLVLILGSLSDIKDNKIDSSFFKAFFVPKGTVIEVYATSLHFCPCETNSSGFGCVVALPKGTNTPLENEYDNKILFRKNKWLLSHVDNESLLQRGAVAGIYGENYKIDY